MTLRRDFEEAQTLFDKGQTKWVSSCTLYDYPHWCPQGNGPHIAEIVERADGSEGWARQILKGGK